jgi:hypothetical protein
MGVLDDAIREHLELKRRHGAAEEDLRRQEEEALGPARREVAPPEAEDGDGTGEPAPGEIEAAETASADVSDTQVELDQGHTDEETALYEPPSEELELGELPDEREAGHEPPAAHRDEPSAAAHHDEAVAEAHPAAPADDAFDEHDERGEAGDTPQHGFQALDDDEQGEGEPHGDELLAHDDELLDEDERSEEDADVLEDTPDFLQETPEHDRLWFEQKPPRDFDFD